METIEATVKRIVENTEGRNSYRQHVLATRMIRELEKLIRWERNPLKRAEAEQAIVRLRAATDPAKYDRSS